MISVGLTNIMPGETVQGIMKVVQHEECYMDLTGMNHITPK